MALPELKPHVSSETTPPKAEMKVTWLESMLKKNLERNVPETATADKAFALVGDKLDKSLGLMGANEPEVTSPKITQIKEAAPKAPDISKAIGWGLEGKPLTSSPISGSILKLLMEAPGNWKSKIENGIKNGHTYNLLHQPGQRNFFLFDIYTQADGTPKKIISTFEIKNPDDVKPEPAKPTEEILKPPVEEQAFVKIPMIPENEGIATNPDKLPKVKQEIPLAQAPNNHFRLMRSRFGKQEFNQQYPTSADKDAFQAKADANAQPGFVTKIREYEAEQEATKPTFLEWAFGKTPAGKTLEQWNAMKNVPAKAFLYPEQYSWEGMPQDLTIENYPDEFKLLRTKTLGAIEKLGLKGENITTMPLQEALDKIVDLGLI